MKFSAKVIKGVQVGMKFGIATANLELDKIPQDLKEGVYLVEVTYEENIYKGLLHFGARKTFGASISAEVHILEFEKDIYEEVLDINILKFSRKIQEFQNADALFTQIEKDIFEAEKFFIRKNIFESWENLDEKEKNRLAKVAFEELKEHEIFLSSENIFVYAPEKDKEINFTDLLMEFFPEKKYFFPIVKQKNLEFYAVEKYENLKPGKFEILEPILSENSKKVDLRKFSKADLEKTFMIVPAVGGDENLNRIGRGGGFYDRFLGEIESQEIFLKTLMIIPEFALLKNIPCEKWDIPVDEIIAL